MLMLHCLLKCFYILKCRAVALFCDLVRLVSKSCSLAFSPAACLVKLSSTYTSYSFSIFVSIHSIPLHKCIVPESFETHALKLIQIGNRIIQASNDTTNRVPTMRYKCCLPALAYIQANS